MTIEEVKELKKDIECGGWATEDDTLELIKLVERLKEEREWLIKRYSESQWLHGRLEKKEYEQLIIQEMKQALKDK